MTARTAGVLLSKSVAVEQRSVSGDANRAAFAARSRFSRTFVCTTWDYLGLLLFLLAAALAVWMGR